MVNIDALEIAMDTGNATEKRGRANATKIGRVKVATSKCVCLVCTGTASTERAAVTTGGMGNSVKFADAHQAALVMGNVIQGFVSVSLGIVGKIALLSRVLWDVMAMVIVT